MTVEQLQEKIDDRFIIGCNSAAERNAALKFLGDIGYRLSPASERHVINQDNDDTFLCPGMSQTVNNITVYRRRDTLGIGRCIDYEDIAELIEEFESASMPEEIPDDIFSAILLAPQEKDAPTPTDPFAGRSDTL